MSENTTAGRKEIATKNVDDVNKDIEKYSKEYANGNNVSSCFTIFLPSKERIYSNAENNGDNNGDNNGGNNDGLKKISGSVSILGVGKIGLIDNLLINQGALIHPGDSKGRGNKNTQKEKESENPENSIDDDGMSK